MKGKIIIEEHYGIPESLKYAEPYFGKDIWKMMNERFQSFEGYRMEQMDEHGIEMMVLSLNCPGTEVMYDAKESIEVAMRSNDALAEVHARHPNRFHGWAALPLQDVDAACKELHRAVEELGLVGVLFNGYVQIGDANTYKYLDDPMYRPLWAELEKLDVPIYLHPREPMPENSKMWDGCPWLGGATWAFTVETASHMMRLLTSSIFDEYPKAKLICGHYGEGLASLLWRNQNVINRIPRGIPAKKNILEYAQNNCWFTTSSNFRTSVLQLALSEWGSDRILFAIDYPYEKISEGAQWFDAAMPLSEVDRYKIGRQNAIDLLKLDMPNIYEEVHCCE